MARTKTPAAGKYRMPRHTKFPSVYEVQREAQRLGADITATEPGQESSRELTDWYVKEFCNANKLIHQAQE